VRHISKPISYFKIHLLSGISGGQLNDLENVNQKSTMRYYKVDNSKTSVAVLVDGKWQFFSLDI
ncbi:hypothetical protein ACPB1N_21660, partial [Escherichia coli]